LWIDSSLPQVSLISNLPWDNVTHNCHLNGSKGNAVLSIEIMVKATAILIFDGNLGHIGCRLNDTI